MVSRRGDYRQPQAAGVLRALEIAGRLIRPNTMDDEVMPSVDVEHPRLRERKEFAVDQHPLDAARVHEKRGIGRTI